ncbi:xanthine dehydrogenase accessory protein XdhC [Uliginosibacterium sp. 31-12]|uniref:xanthine dehydrogenase accessory protein XdhC n=1 Tax=Uliginosibacterium sp. 31-12 TaxID=3062781 RepID=UPI0026E46520|nr:xanthine dehydrogenase accessory protein XdhC [Uliginosibacterium sp. 31-12]MDO6388135.1 xanthine dehydrogenase accessory protein XdhC [Uliginosibacterium sp. 31-12]
MSWLTQIPTALAHGPLVLVSVAGVRGSAPREAGASMLVGADFVVDTIGGGHLEWEAMAEARAMLLTGHRRPELRRYALAASLGQCCGGIVWLSYETLRPEDAAAWQASATQHASGIALLRQLNGDAAASCWSAGTASGALKLPTTESARDWSLTQPLTPPAFCLNVYGAGHVGTALVTLLAPLNLRLRWIDPRADLLAAAPAGVECQPCDAADEAVSSAPTGSSHLVLTHDHALDLALTEAILRRGDFAHFGLIGSQSKRTRFRQQLAARGFTPAQIERMQCPIGVPGIRDKTPQAIAIGVAAQVLQWREALITPTRTGPDARMRSN